MDLNVRSSTRKARNAELTPRNSTYRSPKAGLDMRRLTCRSPKARLDMRNLTCSTRKVKFHVWNVTCFSYATPTSVIGAAIGSAGASTENALSTDDIRASNGVLIVDVDVSSANAGALAG